MLERLRRVLWPTSEIERLHNALLYAIKQLDDTRDAALEEAALIADEQYAEPGWCGDYKTAAASIAAAIREQKEDR